MLLDHRAVAAKVYIPAILILLSTGFIFKNKLILI